ncbi:transposase domain-containing protein [Streptomyces coelicoflavus]|uniref:transposase domain-containing protein n=1 Tax=Streptomyces TaxID=1883 RepID=UPI00325416C2
MYAPGHLGELTDIIDPELIGAVLEDTGARQQRLRLLDGDCEVGGRAVNGGPGGTERP